MTTPYTTMLKQDIRDSVDELFATLRQLANVETLSEVDMSLAKKLAKINTTGIESANDSDSIEDVLNSLTKLEMMYLLSQALISAKRYNINVHALQMFHNLPK